MIRDGNFLGRLTDAIPRPNWEVVLDAKYLGRDAEDRKCFGLTMKDKHGLVSYHSVTWDGERVGRPSLARKVRV